MRRGLRDSRISRPEQIFYSATLPRKRSFGENSILEKGNMDKNVFLVGG